MVIPFLEILRRAGARLSNTGTSTSNANDLYPKLKDWCNERYERVYETYPWRASLSDITLQIVASQKDYGLDRDIQKIWAVFDQTNGRIVTERDVQTHTRFFAEDLDTTGNVQVGDPRRYFFIGDFTVKNAIGSSAEKLDVVSSSTLDLTPNVVAITGLVSSVELTETIILTGTTTATSTNTFDASQKLRVVVGTNDETRKSVVGAITVDGNTSSDVFSKVSPKEHAPIYKWIRTSVTPKATGTQPVWLIWYSKRIQLLVDDNDIPIIDIANALVQGIYADGLREDGQEQEAQLAEQKFEGMVNEKRLADTGPNLLEQFVPQSADSGAITDFGRTI